MKSPQPMYNLVVVAIVVLSATSVFINDRSSVGYGDIVAICLALIGLILSLIGPFRGRLPRNRILFIVCAAICLYVGIIAIVRLALSGVGGAP